MQDNCFPSSFAAAQQSQHNAANRRLISIEAKTQAEEMEGGRTVVQWVLHHQRPAMPQTQHSRGWKEGTSAASRPFELSVNYCHCVRSLNLQPFT